MQSATPPDPDRKQQPAKAPACAGVTEISGDASGTKIRLERFFWRNVGAPLECCGPQHAFFRTRSFPHRSASALPGDGEAEGVAQDVGAGAEMGDPGEGGGLDRSQARAGGIDTDQADQRGFAGGGILAGRLADDG